MLEPPFLPPLHDHKSKSTTKTAVILASITIPHKTLHQSHKLLGTTLRTTLFPSARQDARLPSHHSLNSTMICSNTQITQWMDIGTLHGLPLTMLSLKTPSTPPYQNSMSHEPSPHSHGVQKKKDSQSSSTSTMSSMHYESLTTAWNSLIEDAQAKWLMTPASGF